MNPNIHPFKRWLFENEKTLAVFAAEVGVSQAMLSDIINRKKMPSMGMMVRICEATGGKLEIADFLPQESRPKKRQKA